MTSKNQNNLNGTIDSVEDSIFDKSMKPMLEMTDQKSNKSLGDDMVFATS